MSVEEFKSARDLLLALRDNYSRRPGFHGPGSSRFNWALDWFDGELAKGEAGARPALKILAARSRPTFAELSAASTRLANGLRALGARRGDRLLLMLGNVAPLWISMLAAMKLGLVVIPATTLLSRRRHRRPPRARPRALRHRRRRGRRQIRGRGEDASASRSARRPGWRDYAAL